MTSLFATPTTIPRWQIVLTEPPPRVVSAAERRLGRTIAGLLLVLGALAVVAILVGASVGGTMMGGLLGLAGITLGYAITRLGYHRAGGVVGALSLWAAPLAAFAFDALTEPNHFFVLLMFPLLASLLASYVLPTRDMLIALTISIVGMVIAMRLNNASDLAVLVWPLMLVLGTGAVFGARRVIGMEAAAHRELSETALRITTRALSGTLDLPQVLDLILEQVLRVSGAVGGDVILLKPNETKGAVARWAGRPTALQAHDPDHYWLPVATMANLQEMQRTHAPYIIANTQTHPAWLLIPDSEWIMSSVGAPIELNGETLGFLHALSDKPYAFSQQDAANLKTFAEGVAIAIRHARLTAQSQRTAADLQAEIAARTRELELERRRLQVLLDANGEAIFYTEDQQIQYANNALTRITGYTMDELLGMSTNALRPQDATPEETARLRTITNTVKTERVFRSEARLQRKDGSTFVAGMTISLIDALGEEHPLRAITLLRDISQEKAIAEQQAQFLANASHELRTPITNFITQLSLLRRNPLNFDRHMTTLDELSNRMRELVNDLLDLSRSERGEMPTDFKLMSLRDLIQHMVDQQRPEAAQRSISLSAQLKIDALMIEGDPRRLSQVLINLITNAIRYTPEGGNVIVRAGNTDSSVWFEVQDTGVGIAPDRLEAIFQPFYRVTEEKQGTGLGLTISKSIVVQHGGTISVESQPREGSRFIVTLPRAQTPVAPERGP